MLGAFLSILHTPATAPDAKLKAVFSFSFDIVSSYFFLATFIPAMLKILARREIKALLAISGVALIAFAFSN